MALPTASDNPFPSILITEGTEPAAPAAGKQRLYIDSTSHKLKRTDSSGTDVTIEGAASGAATASGLTMATARLLGRTTASTGALEEITVGSGLSLSAGALTATGGGTGTITTVKDEGSNLSTAVTSIDFVGAGVTATGTTAVTVTIPGGGAFVFLEAHTASSSATLDFTTFISSTYDTYVFHFVSLLPATDGAVPLVRVGTGGGPTYDSGANYGWQVVNSSFGSGADGVAGSSGDTSIHIFNGGQSSSYPFSGSMDLWDPQNASARKNFSYHGPVVFSTGPAQFFVRMDGVYQTTTALTAVRFLYSTGNIASGTIRVYGITKS